MRQKQLAIDWREGFMKTARDHLGDLFAMLEVTLTMYIELMSNSWMSAEENSGFALLAACAVLRGWFQARQFSGLE